MTNESYSKSILMNLSFNKKNWGARPPQVTMGATPLHVNMSCKPAMTQWV